MGGLYCILVLVIIALSGYILRLFLEKARIKVHSISFKDTFNKTDVAIISLYNNGKKLNFIVDTGSSQCLITKSILPELSYETLGASGAEFSTFGGDASMQGHEAIKMALTKNGNTFIPNFIVVDLDTSFPWDEEELGEKVHGIIGSRFLRDYSLLLDFDNLSVHDK